LGSKIKNLKAWVDGLALLSHVSHGEANKAFPTPLAWVYVFICWLKKLAFKAHKRKRPSNFVGKAFVPKTGFEPARRFQRYHLKVVRLPISPPGQGECKIMKK
jgi:hypothetical protein